MVVDPNNQQYYDLGAPAPAPAPWWKRREVLTRLGLGVLAGVLLVLVGYYIYQYVSFDAEEVAKQDAAQALIDEAEAKCADEEDPEACMTKARTDAAETTGSALACQGLHGQELKNCAQLIAIDEGDTEPCGVIEDEADRSECEDAALLVKAKAESDYGVCASISSAETKAACEAQLIEGVVAAGECEKYGIEVARCSFVENLDEVVASGNPTGCASFVGVDRETCEDHFTSLDADGDGLNRLKEYQLGTSDDKADTDGDGYGDGQEVASGHDPLN